MLDITVQVGAGVQKVVNQQTKKISQDEVVNMLDEMETWQQLQFMHKAYEVLILSEYKINLL